VNEVVPFCVLATLFIALITFGFNPVEERVCMLECYCVRTKSIVVKKTLSNIIPYFVWSRCA
jgi:hypothetical protein